MVIGIDASMLVYQGSGVATYTYNLIKSLLKFDKKNEYRIFYSSRRVPEDTKRMLSEIRNLGGKIYRLPLPPWVLKFIWNKNQLFPIEWFIGRVDYLHSSDFLRPPLLKGTVGITTVHDLTWKIFPEYHTQDIIDAHTRKLELTMKGEDLIICDSLNTKKDLEKYYEDIRKRSKIVVIYPGVDEKFSNVKNENRIKQILSNYKIKYPSNYLLYVGAIEPRKNLETAIKVFANLIKDKKFADFEFLIVGRAGWKNEKVFRLIAKLGLNKKINFVGYVDDQDLIYFYNACKVFIYLSLYEGFGLPPLEAALCGTPVLLYNNSSLKEIFPKNYLFTEKGEELETLKKIINFKPRLENFAKRFNWKKYVKDYLLFIDKNESSRE